MFCRHVFGNISGGFRGISRFFWKFRGISRKYLNFAGPRPRKISEALFLRTSWHRREGNWRNKLLDTSNIIEEVVTYVTLLIFIYHIIINNAVFISHGNRIPLFLPVVVMWRSVVDITWWVWSSFGRTKQSCSNKTMRYISEVLNQFFIIFHTYIRLL